MSGAAGQPLERRAFEATLDLRERAEQGGQTLTGYAALFGIWSEDLGGFRERLEPGAFRTAQGSDVRALWNHDPAFVLGRTTNGTLRLEEDAHGLRVEIDPPQGPLYAGFLENVRRGDVTQMSFGFSVVADEKVYSETGERLRVLKEVRLYEVSPVTFPAYVQTEVSVREWPGREDECVERTEEGEGEGIERNEETEGEDVERDEERADVAESGGEAESDGEGSGFDSAREAEQSALRQRRLRLLGV